MLKRARSWFLKLLLKDDSLVKVDDIAETNSLKVLLNGQIQYIDITSSSSQFPPNAYVFDSILLLPFDIKAGMNKQVWLTLHVPSDTHPGDYTGTVSITSGSTALGSLPITLTVLPFNLQKPTIEYAIYYTPVLQPKPTKPLSSEYKSHNQYYLELINMKNHGISYPTLYQGLDPMLKDALLLRIKAGLPNDKLYMLAPILLTLPQLASPALLLFRVPSKSGRP